MRKIPKLISAAVLFLVVKAPIFAFFPTGGGSSNLPSGRAITLTDIDYLIFRVSTFFITTSAVLVVIFIIWSGVSYMYAGADPKKVETAQGRLRSGIIGAAIIFGVGVIIQTIVSVVTLDFFCTTRVPIIGTCIY